eukprot:6976757-Prymnesium_polylepis.1
MDALSCLFRGLFAARDAVERVPSARWDVVAATRSLQASCASRCLFGGFMAEVQLIDTRFFDLSFAEVAAMDPQQR